MHNYRELDVWKRSRGLVKEVYLITKQLPKEELFGLTSQIRRSVISIPSNIAEGAGRSTDKDFAQFLSIGLGSSYELETQILVSFDLGFIPKEDCDRVVNETIEIQKMIFNLRRKLKS